MSSLLHASQIELNVTAQGYLKQNIVGINHPQYFYSGLFGSLLAGHFLFLSLSLQKSCFNKINKQ